MFLLLSACAENPEVLLARGLAANDPRAALDDLAQACEAGLIPACDAAGALPVEDARKKEWNERACEAGVVAACVRRSEGPMDRFIERACDLGDAASCGTLADAGGDPAIFRKACLAGHRPSCLPAGDAARAQGDKAAAIELYEVRCAHDPDDTACLLVARLKEEAPSGELTWPKGDPAAVSEILWAGCARNEAWDCLRLSQHVLAGGPLPETSRGDAHWLRDQACDLQLVYACAPHAW